VFLSHYTASGLSEILDLDVDFFDKCLTEAIEMYKKENSTDE